jgi:ankyrin repeat protein
MLVRNETYSGYVDTEDGKGRTALHLADRSGSGPATAALLKAGSSKDVVDSGARQWTALHYAADANGVRAIEALLAVGASRDAMCGEGRTPYETALTKGNEEAASLLDDRFALHRAAAAGDVATVTLLLDEGVDVNLQRDDGATALCVGAANGRTEVLDLLIRHGGDPSRADARGDTPLHFACHIGHVPCTERLLREGARVNPSHVNTSGGTALHSAASGLAPSEYSIDLVVKSKPAVLGAQDNNQRTALHAAGLSGNLHAVRALLAAGASRADTDRAGQRSYDLALSSGHLEAAGLLADPDAFIAAAADGEDEVVRAAIFSGHLCPPALEQALRAAAARGHRRVVRLFLEARVSPLCALAEADLALMGELLGAAVRLGDSALAIFASVGVLSETGELVAAADGPLGTDGLCALGDKLALGALRALDGRKVAAGSIKFTADGTVVRILTSRIFYNAMPVGATDAAFYERGGLAGVAVSKSFFDKCRDFLLGGALTPDSLLRDTDETTSRIFGRVLARAPPNPPPPDPGAAPGAPPPLPPLQQQPELYLSDLERHALLQVRPFLFIDTGDVFEVAAQLVSARRAFGTSDNMMDLAILAQACFSARHRAHLRQEHVRAQRTATGSATPIDRVLYSHGDTAFHNAVLAWIRRACGPHKTGMPGFPIVVVGYAGNESQAKSASNKLVKFLSRHLPVVKSSEFRTSAKCPLCGGDLALLQKKFHRSKVCTSAECPAKGVIVRTDTSQAAAGTPVPVVGSPETIALAWARSHRGDLGAGGGEAEADRVVGPAGGRPLDSPAWACGRSGGNGGAGGWGEAEADRVSGPLPRRGPATKPPQGAAGPASVNLAVHRDLIAAIGIGAIWLSEFLGLPRPAHYVPDAGTETETAGKSKTSKGKTGTGKSKTSKGKTGKGKGKNGKGKAGKGKGKAGKGKGKGKVGKGTRRRASWASFSYDDYSSPGTASATEDDCSDSGSSGGSFSSSLSRSSSSDPVSSSLSSSSGEE